MVSYVQFKPHMASSLVSNITCVVSIDAIIFFPSWDIVMTIRSQGVAITSQNDTCTCIVLGFIHVFPPLYVHSIVVKEVHCNSARRFFVESRVLSIVPTSSLVFFQMEFAKVNNASILVSPTMAKLSKLPAHDVFSEPSLLFFVAYVMLLMFSHLVLLGA